MSALFSCLHYGAEEVGLECVERHFGFDRLAELSDFVLPSIQDIGKGLSQSGGVFGFEGPFFW